MRKLATAALSFTAAILISKYFLPYDFLPLFGIAAALTSIVGIAFRGNIRLRIIISLLSLAIGFGWCWAYTAIFIAPSSDLLEEPATVSAIVT